jgi:hypothetical protein
MGGDEDWTYPRAMTIVTDTIGRAFRDGLFEDMGYADAARHAHEVVQKLVADCLPRTKSPGIDLKAGPDAKRASNVLQRISESGSGASR